ncbi:hypothetical protein [Paraflavitalea speifideaquila]|uniref:hypothetical protein n=1 Tax=Paraflavitalea speifideaquila TaxID=3076558 RepID=UPI0028E8F6D8|nr:hypothetical protein [Paraflavitalea speifideiaquila]
MGLAITYKDFGGNLNTENRVLAINYMMTGGYKNKATYIRTGFTEVTVKITSVTVSRNGNWDPLPGVKVVNQLNSFPQYLFTYSGNSIGQVSDSAWAANSGRDDLPVWWTPSIGADEYDLEWAYIDSAALAAGRYNNALGQPDAAKIFAFNASRVSVTSTAYRIPLLYDSKGDLFYRVRAVQVKTGAAVMRPPGATLLLPGMAALLLMAMKGPLTGRLPPALPKTANARVWYNIMTVVYAGGKR